MNQILKLMGNIVPKEMKPKFFSMVFNFSPTNTSAVFHCVCYSLDEAIETFNKENPTEANKPWQVVLWKATDVEELISPFVEHVEIEETLEEKTNKDELMKLIVKNKDRELLKKHLLEFTVNEVKYMEDKLK